MNQNDQAIEQEIQAKGKTAPRVTPADIEANIADEAYFTAADGVRGSTPGGLRTYVPRDSHKLLTFCVLTLQNGFTVTGESACASPENFDAEIGRKVARQNAVQKIWPLMGYALKEQLCRQKGWACPDCCQGFAEMPTTCPNNAPGCNELLAKGK